MNGVVQQMEERFYISNQQEGEKPNSEGWYDFSKNQTDAVLSVYALEECSIYSGANVKVDKFWGVPKYFPNGDLDSCLKDAFSTIM